MIVMRAVRALERCPRERLTFSARVASDRARKCASEHGKKLKLGFARITEDTLVLLLIVVKPKDSWPSWVWKWETRHWAKLIALRQGQLGEVLQRQQML
jgi:hypothetical protein